MAKHHKSRNQVENPQTSTTGTGAGCFLAAISTLVTCLLLFVNGGLIAAICSALIRSGSTTLANAGVNQFVLFCGPVVLVVIEWIMIDYVVSRFRRSQ
jgi:hypothetical protein